MRKALYGLGAVLALLVGAAVLVPRLLDFNQYKPEIAAQVHDVTGRDLVIGGDISLTILPSLALVVSDVQLANAPNGLSDNMVRIREAQVEVALLPLLSGSIEMQRVRLVEPEVVLEVLPGGGNNWEMGPPKPESPNTEPATIETTPETNPPTDAAAPAVPTEPAPSESADAQADDDQPSISVENFEIENGLIIYRDLPAGREERVEDLNATIRAASLDGPLESQGTFRIRGIALGFDFGLGNIRERTLVPARLRLIDDAKGLDAEFRGHVSGLRETPRIEGTISAQGDILAAAIQSVAPQSLPGFLAQPFSLKGKIDATPDGGSLGSMTLTLGETSANGELSASLAEIKTVTAQLAVGSVDLDTWLAMPPVSPPSAAASAAPADTSQTASARSAENGATSSKPKGDDDTTTSAPAPESASEASAPSLLPKNLAADVTVTVEAVAFRGKSIHQVRAVAAASQGEVTISQLSALLPGGADAAAFGFLTMADGPRFEGNLEARATDLTGLLSWIGVDTSRPPLARLRSLSATTSLVATDQRLEANDLDVQIDRSRITGRMSAGLGGDRKVTADLNVDRVNLDDLLAPAKPVQTPDPTPTGDSDAEASSPTETPPASSSTEAPAQPAGEAADGTASSPRVPLNADLRLRVGTLTWRGVPASNIQFDGTYNGQTLSIRSAGIGDMAGAQAQVRGDVIDPAGAPRFKALTVEATVPDPARSARMFGMALPSSVAAMGAVSVAGQLDGALAAPEVELRTKALNTTVSAAGTANLMAPPTDEAAQPSGGPVFDGSISVISENIVPLIAALSPGYRPAGPIGATNFKAQVAAQPTQVALTQINGPLAGVVTGGSVSVRFDGGRPKVDADMTLGDLVVDHFLPADRAADLPWHMIPAAWRPAPVLPTSPSNDLQPAAVHSRWSRDPVDVSGLRQFDADIRIRAQSIRFDRYVLADANASGTLQKGLLTLSELTGSLFGGPFRSSGTLNATSVPAFTVSADAKNADLRQASGGAGGRVTLQTSLSGRGSSAADVIGSLDGQGSITVRGLDARTDPTTLPVLGPLLSAVIGPTQLLDKSLGGVLKSLGGGMDDARLVSASGTFVIKNGILTSQDIAFNSPLYNGKATGTLNLPNWYMEVPGTIQLSGNLVGTLLGGVAEIPKDIAFRAYGPPDKPQVAVNLKGLTSLKIPGIDQLKKKSPEAGKFLERLLPGLGGGGGSSESPPSGTGSDIERTLRGLFR